jgi:hypothetical protein
MLGASLNVRDIAAHSPDDIDWNSLPDGFITAMHWHYTTQMQRLLYEKKIETLVTVRHPLDVLISILQFCQFEPATAQWLNGEGGNEASLMGANPTDRCFLDYALSDRAAALLSVSLEWAPAAKAIVHYEDLVENPHQTMSSVLKILEEPQAQGLDDVILAYRFPELKAVIHHHAWRGQPGLWKSVVVEEYRQAIYQRHRGVFDGFGYRIEAQKPEVEEARSQWRELVTGRGPE